MSTTINDTNTVNFLKKNEGKTEAGVLDCFYNSPRMTKEFIRKHCKEHRLYQTPHLNDVLYLHFKGFSYIENLEEYTGLKCLWLENNGIREISGLGNQQELRSLFLHYNLIRKIENLEGCPILDTLNLSHNQVKKIENLSKIKIHTLNLSNNYVESMNDFEHLAELLELSVLDLANNHVEDPLIVEVLSTMPDLRVLNLMGNPVLRKIPAYRKTLILACKNLQYLDDRPVFPRDRACAEAWQRGGITEENAERQRWIERERKRIMDSVNALIDMRDRRRAERAQELRGAQSDSGMGTSMADSESEAESVSEKVIRSQVEQSENSDSTSEDDEIPAEAQGIDYIRTQNDQTDEDSSSSDNDDEFMRDHQTTEDYSQYRQRIFDFSPTRVREERERKRMVQEIDSSASNSPESSMKSEPSEKRYRKTESGSSNNSYLNVPSTSQSILVIDSENKRKSIRDFDRGNQGPKKVLIEEIDDHHDEENESDSKQVTQCQKEDDTDILTENANQLSQSNNIDSQEEREPQSLLDKNIENKDFSEYHNEEANATNEEAPSNLCNIKTEDVEISDYQGEKANNVEQEKTLETDKEIRSDEEGKKEKVKKCIITDEEKESDSDEEMKSDQKGKIEKNIFQLIAEAEMVTHSNLKEESYLNLEYKEDIYKYQNENIYLEDSAVAKSQKVASSSEDTEPYKEDLLKIDLIQIEKNVTQKKIESDSTVDGDNTSSIDDLDESEEDMNIENLWIEEDYHTAEDIPCKETNSKEQQECCNSIELDANIDLVLQTELECDKIIIKNDEKDNENNERIQINEQNSEEDNNARSSTGDGDYCSKQGNLEITSEKVIERAKAVLNLLQENILNNEIIIKETLENISREGECILEELVSEVQTVMISEKEEYISETNSENIPTSQGSENKLEHQKEETMPEEEKVSSFKELCPDEQITIISKTESSTTDLEELFDNEKVPDQVEETCFFKLSDPEVQTIMISNEGGYISDSNSEDISEIERPFENSLGEIKLESNTFAEEIVSRDSGNFTNKMDKKKVLQKNYGNHNLLSSCDHEEISRFIEGIQSEAIYAIESLMDQSGNLSNINENDTSTKPIERKIKTEEEAQKGASVQDGTIKQHDAATDSSKIQLKIEEKSEKEEKETCHKTSESLPSSTTDVSCETLPEEIVEQKLEGNCFVNSGLYNSRNIESQIPKQDYEPILADTTQDGSPSEKKDNSVEDLNEKTICNDFSQIETDLVHNIGVDTSRNKILLIDTAQICQDSSRVDSKLWVPDNLCVIRNFNDDPDAFDDKQDDFDNLSRDELVRNELSSRDAREEKYNTMRMSYHGVLTKQITINEADSSSEEESDESEEDTSYYAQLDKSSTTDFSKVVEHSTTLDHVLQREELQPVQMHISNSQNYCDDFKEFLQWDLKVKDRPNRPPLETPRDEEEPKDELCELLSRTSRQDLPEFEITPPGDIVDENDVIMYPSTSKRNTVDKTRELCEKLSQDTYKSYFTESGRTPSGDSYKEPKISGILRASKNIPVFQKNQDTMMEIKREEEEEYQIPNSIIASNSISNIRDSLADFVQSFHEFNERSRIAREKIVNDYNEAVAKQIKMVDKIMASFKKPIPNKKWFVNDGKIVEKNKPEPVQETSEDEVRKREIVIESIKRQSREAHEMLEKISIRPEHLKKPEGDVEEGMNFEQLEEYLAKEQKLACEQKGNSEDEEEEDKEVFSEEFATDENNQDVLAKMDRQLEKISKRKNILLEEVTDSDDDDEDVYSDSCPYMNENNSRSDVTINENRETAHETFGMREAEDDRYHEIDIIPTKEVKEDINKSSALPPIITRKVTCTLEMELAREDDASNN